jgi:hypothetical protein
MKLSSAHGPKMPRPRLLSRLLPVSCSDCSIAVCSGTCGAVICGARPSACPARHSTEARSASLLHHRLLGGKLGPLEETSQSRERAYGGSITYNTGSCTTMGAKRWYLAVIVR